MSSHQDYDMRPEYDGPDPLRRNAKAGRAINVLWLNSDSKLEPIQKIYFFITSMVFVFAGYFCFAGARSEFNDSIAWTFFWTIAGTPFMYLGLRGMWRIYKSL